MSYELRGLFFEACDCNVMCPCWFDDDPDENECTGMIAWHVDTGRIEDIDVSNLTAVSVSHHGGHRRDGHARVALLVDANATAEQERALVDAFTGNLGGPLAELAQLTEEVERVERVPIVFESDGATTEVTAGVHATARMKPIVGSTGRVITVSDSALATLLGSPAEAGRSQMYRLDLARDEFDLVVGGRSANRGRFAYVHLEEAASD